MAIYWNVQGGTSRKVLVNRYHSSTIGVAVPDPVVPYPGSSITINGSVPPGLGISHGAVTTTKNTYYLSGTPTTPGVYSFSGYVTSLADGSTTSIGTYTVSVCSGHLNRKSAGRLVRNANKHLVIGGTGSGPAPLNITTAALPNVPNGSYYSVQMAASGGTAPYAWSVQSGAFPSGISMSASGLIAGTSTASAGSYTVVIRCADSAGQSTTKQFNFSMLANPSSNICFELTQYISDSSLYFFVLDPSGYEYFPLWSWGSDPGHWRNSSYFAPVLGTNSDYSNGVTPNGGYTYASPLLTSPYRFVDQVAWTNGNSPSGIYKFYFFYAGGYDSSYFRLRIYTNGNSTPFWERYATIGVEERPPYHPCSRLYTYNSVSGLVSSN